ncbi:MAG TPA: preprotein translocase subunit SecE [Rhodanobacteraceae bacterium]|nr:preprotein translocase subunit SecE [Rhodanobacteraceae bacterium]
MNAKVERAGGINVVDMAKLALAVLLLAAGIAGYYWYANASSPLRLIGVTAAIVAACAVAAFTAPGRAVREYLRETQFEMRKVVWPTRQETIRTTAVVILVVVVLSVLLGLIDVFLKWAILDHLLKIGT